ncbi:MAG: alpha-hydroxy-acid oxidizing protein [Chloroflexi bacterium]|nr:alpha-hydroxy-acid oxidizing protein [Chloroflexota bacterium]
MVAVEQQFVTLNEIRRAARANLSPEVWDYASGGAETETSLRRNRRAMSNYVFVPRVLRDVSHIDTTTTFLGMPLALPIMIAPMGSMFLLHPDGDLALARAAGQMGTIYWLSTMTRWLPEEVAAAATGPLIFQLYWRGDHAWAEALLRRVEAAGFRGIALTVDTAAYGRRERDIEKRYDPRGQGSRLWQGFPPPLQGDARMASLTWDDVDWLKRTTRLPLIVKGIQSVEDARLCVEHGVDCVYISNHGGRQLDYAPAPIELVAEVAEAVAGRAEVVVDGGFQRGTDVLKALALGARAVCIGKAAAWGLAAAGAEGAARVLELLHLELRIAMANTGQTSVREVGPWLVRRACACE